jgi:DNA adenine methylase
MTKTINTCLRYPGGKKRAIAQITENMPKNFLEYREPFVGGGSLFIREMPKTPERQVRKHRISYFRQGMKANNTL